jgi:hypothetical protein
MSYTRATKYRVLRDAVTYPGSDNMLCHAKLGDIVTDYPPTSAKHDVYGGVLEVVVDKKDGKGKEVDD